MSKILYTIPTTITASTVIHTVPCFLMKIVIGSDGTNNPTLAAYNEANSSATASKQIMPSQTYDAVSLGINGIVYQFAEYCDTGLYVSIAGAGSVVVVVSTRTKSSLHGFKLL